MAIDPPAIRAWLVRLSLGIPAAAEIADLASRIDQSADMLAAKAPSDLFTADSLEFCLRRFKFFPSYADLWGRLQTYQREHSKHLALSGPAEVGAVVPVKDGDAGMSAADRWMAGRWKAFRSGGTPLSQGVGLAGWLNMCRTKCPAAYRYIVGTDPEAASIAVRHHWPDPASHQAATATHEDKAAVSAAVDRVRRGFVPAQPVESSPPEPDPALSQSAQPAADVERVHGRKPGVASAEQLREMRKGTALGQVLAEKEAREAAAAVRAAPVQASPATPKPEPPRRGLRAVLSPVVWDAA